MCFIYLPLLLSTTESSRLAQQQGLDGKIVAGRGRDIEQHLAQGVDLEDLDVLFPSVLYVSYFMIS